MPTTIGNPFAATIFACRRLRSTKCLKRWPVFTIRGEAKDPGNTSFGHLVFLRSCHGKQSHAKRERGFSQKPQFNRRNRPKHLIHAAASVAFLREIATHF